MGKLFIVGIGPGNLENMSVQAVKALQQSEIIVGYSGYMEYIETLITGKEVFQTGMTGEIERCKYAVEKVKEGKTVSLISSGDAGLYGMAGPALEIAPKIDIEIIPGISAAFAAAAKLGAPLMHDTALISLSDKLTDYAVIKKRIAFAAEADFVIALYNPKSKTRLTYIEEAVNIMLTFKSPSTPAGIVKNAYRKNEKIIVTRLGNIDYTEIDMFTLIIVGNKDSYIHQNKIITPRGYKIK